MKITDVDVVVGPASPSTGTRWRDGLPLRASRGEIGALRITTDDGVTGYAYGDPRMLADQVERHFRRELLGQDPFQREYLWKRMWELHRLEYYSTPSLGILDLALWDLAGRALDLPVYQLLGGSRTELPAYASTRTFATIPEYLDVITQCLELGYHGIKLHAWGDAKRDIELSLRVREHVGPDVPLMFDASGGFDLADAVRVGKALAEADYLWYEEPMQEFNITSHKWLADQVGVPLLVAEITEGAHRNTADFLAAGAAGFVRTSAGFKGGITGAMRIAHLADAFQVRAEVHGPGAANEHLCMAISNTTYYESLVLDLDVKQDPRLNANQYLPAPITPGVAEVPEWANAKALQLR